MKKTVNAYSSMSANLGDKVICDGATQVFRNEGIDIDCFMPVVSTQNPLKDDYRFADVNIILGHPLYGLDSFSEFLSAMDCHKTANSNSKFFALGLGLRGSLDEIDEQEFNLSSFDAVATRDDNLFIHLNTKYKNIYKSACLSYFLPQKEFVDDRSNDRALVFPVISSYAIASRVHYGLEYWRNLFEYLRSELNFQEIDIGLVDPRDELFFKKLCNKKTRCLTFTDLEQLKLIGQYNLTVSARLHMAIAASRYCPNLKVIPIDHRVSQLLNYSEEKNQLYLPPTQKRNVLGRREAIFKQNDLVDFLDKHRFDPTKSARFPGHTLREIKNSLTDSF